MNQLQKNKEDAFRYSGKKPQVLLKTKKIWSSKQYLQKSKPKAWTWKFCKGLEPTWVHTAATSSCPAFSFVLALVVVQLLILLRG